MKIKLLKITQIAKDAMGRVLLTLTNGNVNTLTAIQYGPNGDDSPPIKNAIVAYSGTEMDGRNVCTGVMTKNSKAKIGEKRLYATDENGAFKCVIWLRDDGTMLHGDSDVPEEYVNFAVMFNELKTEFNELKASHNDLVSKHNANAILLGSHTHPYINVVTPAVTSASGVPGQSGTPSIANIDNAKNTKIKYK